VTQSTESLRDLEAEMDRLRASGEWNEAHFVDLSLKGLARGADGNDLEFLMMYAKREWMQRLRAQLRKEAHSA